MNKITYRFVYNRRGRLNDNGTALLQIEAYLHRRKKYFSTHVYLKPKQWNEKKQRIKKHPNADDLNEYIYGYLTEIEHKELDLWKRGKHITLELLKETVYESAEDGDFIVFMKQKLENCRLKKSSQRNHLTTLRLLQQFKCKLPFAELTYDTITAFERFLYNKGYHTNTIAKHMKHLKKYVNEGIKHGEMKTDAYPFRRYRIKTVPGRHTHLQHEELMLLENIPVNKLTPKNRKIRDAFLFCCYTGLRYSDFVSLHPENIVEINGETWLVYRSVKTGTEVHLPLFLLFGGKAVRLLCQYSHQLTDFFHLTNNSNVNKVLEQLAEQAGIRTHISFHTSRHTNATLLIYNGVNVMTVQRLLGHKSVKTTQLYASVTDLAIVRDLKLHETMKGNEP